MTDKDERADVDEALSELMDRRRFLKMTGAMAAVLPWLGLPRFAEGKPVQRPAGTISAATGRHTL